MNVQRKPSITIKTYRGTGVISMTNHIRKYVHKQGKKWCVQKHINGKLRTFRRFSNLDDALDYRDRLVENNWEPLPLTDEEIEEENKAKYYKYIYLNRLGRAYVILRKGDSKYLGTVKTIEEALYYRDLYNDCQVPVPKPDEVDLITDNPYLIEGLRYPLPDKLVKPVNTSKYGKGSIFQRSKSSYRVEHGSTLYGSCRTYEQAYYLRMELQKCDWDKSQVDRILADYPKWYTWLLFFYQYISKVKDKDGEWNGKYKVVIPLEYNDGKLEYMTYSRIEDALYERDYLKEHDWDYESLVYCLDDSKNPYYDMELPPYPQRKIKRIREFKTYTEEINRLRDAILEGMDNQEDIAIRLGTNPVSLHNWLMKYDTNWKDFKRLVESGEDIWSVLELKEQYFIPDLSPSMPSNYEGYVQHNGNSKRSPYRIQRKGVYYGCYQDKKTAERVVKELRKVDWDKSYLPMIQEKVGHKEFLNTKRWVYENNKGGYYIRKNDKNRKMLYYGYYKDKEVAEIVRDLLVENDWDKSRLDEFRRIAEDKLGAVGK